MYSLLTNLAPPAPGGKSLQESLEALRLYFQLKWVVIAQCFHYNNLDQIKSIANNDTNFLQVSDTWESPGGDTP